MLPTSATPPAERRPRLQVGDGRDDLFADHLEGAELGHPRHRPYGRLYPERRQAAQVLDDLARSLTLFSDVEAVHDGLFDLVVGAALCLAMATQHFELVGYVGASEQVARLGVASDQPERLFSPDPPMRIGGWGRVTACGELSV